MPKPLRDCEFVTSPSGVLKSPDRRPPPPNFSANVPFPVRTSAAAPASLAADPRSKVMLPDVLRTAFIGMSLVITLTRPPMALAP